MRRPTVLQSSRAARLRRTRRAAVRQHPRRSHPFMSWESGTAQTRIRLWAREPADSHSRGETPTSCIGAGIRRGVFRRPRRRASGGPPGAGRRRTAGGDRRLRPPRHDRSTQRAGSRTGRQPSLTRPVTCCWPRESYKVRLCWPRRCRSWAVGRKSCCPGQSSRRPASSATPRLKRSRSNPCCAVWGAAACRSCPVSSAAPATGGVHHARRGGSRLLGRGPGCGAATRHGSNSARPRSMAFTTPTRRRTATPAASTP